MTKVWTQYTFQFDPPADTHTWYLDLATSGPSEVWMDDVFAGYPGLKPLGLPPGQAVGQDTNALLHLSFEEPLDEYKFFVKGQVHPSKANEGMFGRSLVMGPEGYVACSANEGLDPQCGTIEVWCKFMSPGNDGMAHNIVSVPGPDGMWFGKDQYSHIGFGFSSGWGTLSHAHAEGYAGRWQPGVWRHFAVCWDKNMLQVFVDGKLAAWTTNPKLSRALGPELGIGAPGMGIDDLRISNIARYRVPVFVEKTEK